GPGSASMLFGIQSRMRRAALYLCYYNIAEPLVQTQVVVYLRELARRGFEIHLLTFEKERLDPSAASRIREGLRREGIEWYALGSQGGPPWRPPLYDRAGGPEKPLGVRIRPQTRLVPGRSQVGPALGFPVRWLGGGNLLSAAGALRGDEHAD